MCANSLGISLRGLMNLVDAGEIPYCRIGQRNLRFYVDDLRTWIQERSSQPVRHLDALPSSFRASNHPLDDNAQNGWSCACRRNNLIDFNRNQRSPRRQLFEGSHARSPVANNPTNLSELEQLRRSTSMPLIVAGGRPMVENTFGSILRRAFREVSS